MNGARDGATKTKGGDDRNTQEKVPEIKKWRIQPAVKLGKPRPHFHR